MHEIPAVNADCFFLRMTKIKKPHSDIHLTPGKLNVTCLCCSAQWKITHQAQGNGGRMKCGLATKLSLKTLQCPAPRLKELQPLKSRPLNRETDSIRKCFFSYFFTPAAAPLWSTQTGAVAELLWGTRAHIIISSPGFGTASTEPACSNQEQSKLSSHLLPKANISNAQVIGV